MRLVVSRRIAITFATFIAAMSVGAGAFAQAQPRYMYTLAGSPSTGLAFSGDNGPAVLAGLNFPSDVAVDASGNVYIADADNNLIRKVSPAGIITTAAGNRSGAPCSRNGDGGPATSAFVEFPTSLGFDTAGNLIFLEGCGVRKIDKNGIISSVATLQALAAPIGTSLNPNAFAIDSAGNIYITGNSRVVEVSATGSISLIAGNGTSNVNGDGGPATQAGLFLAFGVAVDSSGSIYVCEPGGGSITQLQFPTAIRKIANGTITTLVSIPMSSNDVPFGNCGLALDSAQNLYISSGPGINNNEVRILSLASGNLSVFAGTGASGAGADGVPATSGGLWFPSGIALDAAGNLYIADRLNQRAVVITSAPIPLRIVASALPVAAIGRSYSAGLAAQFGTAPYTNWTVTSGTLPAGLSLNSSTGVISGTPAGSTGVSFFTVQAIDSAGAIATASYQLTTTLPLIVTTPSLPDAIAGAAYSQTFTAGGGFPPYSNWALRPGTGTLPPGLSLNAATGVLSGVPFGIAAPYSFTISVTDSSGAVASVPLQLTLTAPAPAAMTPLGTFAQIVSGGSWSTTMTLMNQSTGPVTAQINFYDNNGNGLVLTVSVLPQPPQAPPQLRPMITASSITVTLGAKETAQIQTSAFTASIAVGWASILSTAPLNVFATYNFGANAGTAPLTAQSTASIILPFDQTNGYRTGVGIANVTTAASTVTAAFLNQNGAQIGSVQINLPPLGHQSFFLDEVLPASANNLGMVQVQSSGNITAEGFRFTAFAEFESSAIQYTAAAGPPGTLTPVGSFAQIASGGGWSTTMTLANVSTATVNAQINLYDDNGNGLVLPLSVLKLGTSTTVSSLSLTLGPGETVQIRTAASTASIAVGWASILATAPLSGFSAYAMHPFGEDVQVTAALAPQLPTSITLPFDQTNGGHTGAAIANLATVAETVTAAFLNQNGVAIGSVQINLPALGHSSFFLDSVLPASANNLGMVQFQSSGNITVMGLGFGSDPRSTVDFPSF